MRTYRLLGIIGFMAASQGGLPASAAVPDGKQAPAAASPWSAQRFDSPLFAEPLVATTADAAETAALRTALAAYHAKGDPLDRAPLEAFLAAYPQSPWRPALLGNLGLAEAHAGRFSQALADWDAAWQAGRGITHPGVVPFVDRIVGERLQLLTRLGHRAAVEALLEEFEGRTLTGSASEARAAAREGLWQMRDEPESAFLCGPLALQELVPEPRQARDLAAGLAAQPGGFSLDRLSALAREQGLDLAPVQRAADQRVPVPAIVHWKSGHYAALVAEVDGRYQIRDAALGREYWVSQATLALEGSGFYLAPAGQAAAAGWRLLAPQEASRIVGAGYTGSSDPKQTQPCTDTCTCTAAPPAFAGMPWAATQSMLVSLALTDTPLSYTPVKGPRVPLTLTYSQREAYQPATFSYFNFGPKWTYTGLSYIVDNPQSPGAGVQRYIAGGGTVLYSGYASSTGAFTREAADQSLLVLTSHSPITYERRLGDGSKEVYGQSDGHTAYPRRIFLTRIVDAAGNSLELGYDSQVRLTTLTDATGLVTTLQYAHANPLLVTGITDPFGRSATLDYDAQGRLSAISDAIGMTSSFSYAGAGTFIEAMTTPYGTTRFAYGESGTQRWLEITDPQGETERVEFLHGASGIPFSETRVPAGISAFNSYINGRNTYYWDKTAHKQARGDYTQAQIKHWFHDRSNTSNTAGVLESIKNPLESRIWFNYPGQDWAGANGTCDKPSAIARVLPDGSSQVTRMTYNAQGNLTSRTDPKGRVTRYEYDASGLDLLRIRQKTATGEDTLAEITWNAQHRPVSVTDAGGGTTTAAYNDAGQITSLTNPLGETTSYQYDGLGRLAAILNPAGKVQASYTYDPQGRLATETDSEGYTLAYDYDALDRRIRITYPDGTTRETTWDKLDVAAEKDREGRVTRYAHDANRNLTEVTDPLGRTVRHGYEENGLLASLTDAKGNVTRWERDIQGRITAKVYADGSRQTTTYDSAGRRASHTDALNQTKAWRYGIDDRLTGIDYLDALHLTPSVRFTDDAHYPRTVTMTDGEGTSQFAYVPPGTPGAGQVASIDGSRENDTLAFTYDALRRVVTRSIGEGTSAITESFAYDTLGRLTNHTNALGIFTYSYLGQTGQPTSQTLAGKRYRVDYRYESNSRDRHLKAILHRGWLGLPAGRSFFYRHSPEGNITARSILPSLLGERFIYDDADRLTGVNAALLLKWDEGSDADWGRLGMGLPVEAYDYDDADNLTESRVLKRDWQAEVNGLNQIVQANDAPWVHDASGNVLDDGQREYAWDAEDRLIGITDKASGASSAFRYDGFSRRVVVTERANPNAAAVETRYLWCGDEICQARNAADQVVTQYYPQGEAQAGKARYYAQDHLGSVTGVVDANGKILGSRGYTAYGQTAWVSGVQAERGYAGMLRHGPSGLYLTLHRAYDSKAKRWLSRDPIGEEGGLNLYAYVHGNPASRIDPLGLDVYLCRQPAFGWAPIDHHWIRTDTIEAGMGGMRGNVAGNQSGDMLGDPVQVTDHTGRSSEGNASCEEVPNVNEDKVNEQLTIGRPLGNWWPNNQCQSFAGTVLNNARYSPGATGRWSSGATGGW